LVVNEFAIAGVIGNFVKLLVVAMLLLLVYLLVPHTIVAAFFSVLCLLLTGAVIGDVVIIFTNNDYLVAIRQWQSGWAFAPGRVEVADYVIVLPNIVLSGIAFIAAVALCILFGRSLNSARENAATSRAVYRAFALAVTIGVALAMMTAASVAQLNQFGIWSPTLFLGMGIIGVEAVIFSALLAMVLNSWWTSRQIDSTMKGLMEKPLLDSSATVTDGAVPLRYME
jgi:hypothetical protein